MKNQKTEKIAFYGNRLMYLFQNQEHPTNILKTLLLEPAQGHHAS
jgi:hypothetical protein